MAGNRSLAPLMLSLIAVVAHAADGELDPTFGSGGHATFKWSDGVARPAALAIDPMGRIVVAGSARRYAGYTHPQFMVMRVRADGTQDPGFASDQWGFRTYAFDLAGVGAISSDDANAVMVQTDGKAVVTGTASFDNSAHMGAIRVGENGDLDPAFGDGGAAHFGSVLGLWSTGATMDASGRPLLFGSALVSGTNGIETCPALARMTPAGQLDIEFANYGVFSCDGTTQRAEAAVADASGTITLFGTRMTDVPEGADAVRVTPKGERLTTFGQDGSAWLGDRFSEIRAALPLSNGGALIAGGTSSGFQLGLARMRADGTIDPDFGVDGLARAPVDPNSSYSILPTRSHGWLVIGAGLWDVVIVRLTASGVPDRSFGADGVLRVGFAAPHAYLVARPALDAQGRLVVAGNPWTPDSNADFELMRIAVDTDAVFVDDFDDVP